MEGGGRDRKERGRSQERSGGRKQGGGARKEGDRRSGGKARSEERDEALKRRIGKVPRAGGFGKRAGPLNVVSRAISEGEGRERRKRGERGG